MNDTIQLKLALLGLGNVEAGLNHLKASVNSLQGAAKAFSTLGGITTAVGVGSLGAIALAIGNLTKEAINNADAMGKLAQKAGAPIRELSGLAYAGKLADVTQDGLRV